MLLDDLERLSKTDPQGMLVHIDRLPDQVEAAWEMGHAYELREEFAQAEAIVICGMGGSAIGGALVAALAAPECRAPIFVNRDYDLPAFAAGKKCLVIGSSFSGGTEETLAAFAQAAARGTQLLAITRGGKLAELARAHDAPVWSFDYDAQPRAGVGYGFMLPLALLSRLGFVADKSDDVKGALAVMREQQAGLMTGVPVASNRAKQIAGQLIGRVVTIYGAGYLAPVARRWKGQLNENAKAWASFDEFPEVDHNSVMGTTYPEECISKHLVLFLQSDLDHPRNARRIQVTKDLYMLQGFTTDSVRAQGDTPLAHMLSVVHFADYTSFYLAMDYGADPTPIEQIDYVKEQLALA
jgi:glucose/mannose-6-phosphate isomerase